MPADQPDAHGAPGLGRACVLSRPGVVDNSAVVENLALPDLPRGADAGGPAERGVAAEIPGTVEPQVDVQHHGVVKVQEEVLAVGARIRQDLAVQQGRTGGEPALRAADGQWLAGKDVPELLGQAAD